MELACQDIIDTNFLKLEKCSSFKQLFQLDQIIPFCSQHATQDTHIFLLSELPKIKDLSSKDIDHWKNICSLLLTNQGTLRSPNGVNKNIGFPAGKDPEIKEIKTQFQNILMELKE